MEKRETQTTKTIEELKIEGWKALIQSLGLAEATLSACLHAQAERFMLQFQKGSGNYTKEKKKLLEKVTINDIVGHYKRNKQITTLVENVSKS